MMPVSEPTLQIAVDGHSVADQEIQWLRSAYPSTRFRVVYDRTAWVDAVAEATVVFAKSVFVDAIAASSAVRWVQTGTAGVDRLVLPQHPGDPCPWPRHVTLTNARGVHGVPISEQVVAMLLAFATRLHVLIRAADRRTNIANDVRDTKWELSGQTIVIIGLGDIGSCLAHRARALGMRVLGVRRTPVARVPADEAPTLASNCDEVHGLDKLHALLPRADHLALCVPLTSETQHLIGAPELALLPRGAHVYNVGRGALIDGVAMRDALASGHLGGAGLDCVEPSDIPASDDMLWTHPNVILGQHTSGHSPGNSRAITRLFAANLDRFLSGQSLHNIVDIDLGY